MERVSDSITRRATFVVMFLLRVLPFWILPNIASVAALTFGSFVVLICYGGGFGTMPAFTADYFGSKKCRAYLRPHVTAWALPLHLVRCSSRICGKPAATTAVLCT